MPLTNYYEMLSILGEKIHWNKEVCENCFFYELEEMIEILLKRTEEDNKRYKEMEQKQTADINKMQMPSIKTPSISTPNISIPKI